jgi:hypothetical protein
MTPASLTSTESKYHVSLAANPPAQPAVAFAAKPAAAVTGPNGLGTIRGQSSNRTQGDLAHQYLAWSVGGKRFSVGHVLGALTGSVGRVFRKAGDLVQGADNQQLWTSKNVWRYFAGRGHSDGVMSGHRTKPQPLVASAANKVQA